jgi:hypothetical protein
MRRVPALAGVALAAVALAVAHGDENKGRKDNTPPEGFQLLFNGKDLTGWQGEVQIDKRSKMTPDELAAAQKEANEKTLPHWKVEEGVLVCDGMTFLNLATVKDYRDIELYVDWKIEPKGDSGIYLRGEPQVQIWDSDSMNPKRREAGKGSGALWNNSNPKDKVPLKKADHPPGEWNTFHIVMKGDKVTVHLNGELVVDNVALENIWEKGKPLPEAGPILLQSHVKQDRTHGKICFKNIYIKEL